ncbi:hypothetical protein U27_00276 [Candidatus Vecturithrix granuli]|uniref:Uncharacterized protein n=1 Tax=Vecturithrix granuli TaxID=1499967 RepID=A0A081C730_VECG1|nr:hypothetical protein U27_00276 [Candidatus Vecturithrix granuli]
MRRNHDNTQRRSCYVFLCCLIALAVCGCTGIGLPGTSPSTGQTSGTAPTLSNLTISPNPTNVGNIINLTAMYLDPDADLGFGVAAVSVDGESLSRIAFRTTYPSGMLTIPMAVNYYSRPSDVRISLKIRDSSGNWSNAVSTVLSIR